MDALKTKISDERLVRMWPRRRQLRSASHPGDGSSPSSLQQPLSPSLHDTDQARWSTLSSESHQAYLVHHACPEADSTGHSHSGQEPTTTRPNRFLPAHLSIHAFTHPKPRSDKAGDLVSPSWMPSMTSMIKSLAHRPLDSPGPGGTSAHPNQVHSPTQFSEGRELMTSLLRPSARSNPHDPPRKWLSPKQLRNFYFELALSGSGPDSIQDAIISSISYHNSAGMELLRFEITGGIPQLHGVLLLQTPQGNRMIGAIRQATRQCAHFRNMSHTEADEYSTRLFGTSKPSSEAINVAPLRLDEMIILAYTISSHYPRRRTDDQSTHLFIQAMRAGLMRLKNLDATPEGPEGDSLDGKQPNSMDVLLDKVIKNFGYKLLKFHRRILKHQQKNDQSMKEQESRTTHIQEQIDQRYREVAEKEASIEDTIRENEEIMRKIEMYEKLKSRSPTNMTSEIHARLVTDNAP